MSKPLGDGGEEKLNWAFDSRLGISTMALVASTAFANSGTEIVCDWLKGAVFLPQICQSQSKACCLQKQIHDDSSIRL